MTQDQSRVIECTTSRFDGLVAMIDPQSSWVAKWNRIGTCAQLVRCTSVTHIIVPSAEKRVPGLYAVKTSGQLPDYLREKMA